jgi:4-amino-4-deoxychorismate lyase
MAVLVNGQASGVVDPTDRGVAYGDGVFRTCLVREGRVVGWTRHYRKLAADCELLDLPCPPSRVLLDELANAAGELHEAAAKIIVTRGVGPRGYAAPVYPVATRIVLAGPLPQHPENYRTLGVVVRRCQLRLALQPRLAGAKHLNRLENVMARMEWSDPEVAEGILLDTEGHVIEGISSNIFMVRNGVLHTPDLSRCGVSGVTRESIIDASMRHGVPIRVGATTWDELLDAEEVMLVNSLIGAWTIRSCENRIWTSTVWTTRIRDWLNGTDG